MPSFSRSPRNAPPRSVASTLARLGCALPVGYLLTAWAASLAARGGRSEEAALVGNSLCYLIWLGVILWSFAARTVARAVLGLAAAGPLLLVIEIWIQRRIS